VPAGSVPILSVPIQGTPACRLLPHAFARVRGIMAKLHEIHDDTFSSILDRIGILREELVSIERSLERMKDAESKKAKGLPSFRVPRS
jgi:hypothetical protein